MKRENIFKILLSIFIALVIIAIAVSIVFWRKSVTLNNKVSKYLTDDLSLSSETMDEELTTLLDWGNNYFVSDANKGHIYERVANIYKWQGNVLEYYSNLGFANYYLNKAQDYNTIVNLNLDLANYYLLNNSIDIASDTIKEMEEIIYNHSDLVSDQMKCYLYRLKAVYYNISIEYIMALESLEKSNSYINSDQPWGPSYLAINQINEAYAYLNLKQYDKMLEKIQAVEASGYLELEAYRDIFDRDLNLPYYQVLVEYNASINNEVKLEEQLKELVEIAERSDCQPSAFYTLSTLYNNYELSSHFKETVLNLLQEEYNTYLFNEVSDYITLTQSQMENASAYINNINQTKSSKFKKRVSISIVVLVFIFVFLLSFRLYTVAFEDALTKISNRRSLDHFLLRQKRKNSSFNFVMIDIDDFKSINDRFGHAFGDKVLQEIGSYLKHNFSNSNLKCFRYGGEEFALIIFNCGIEGAKVIADAIREGVEKMQWEFDDTITISIGIAHTDNCDDVVKCADNNLYTAKSQGKNIVCAK